MKAVYIHIPFCNNICSYCDFCKMYYNPKIISNYLDNLENEIKTRYQNEIVSSLYIGGGTPSSLSYAELERLLNITKIFKVSNDIEFTIEVNPESLSLDKIKLLKEYGVNRVSIGVQSFNDKIIKELNRDHNKDMVFKVVNMLKENNITNINIDLMYGINSDINIIKEDLDNYLKLDIPHLSYYSLIIEDNTIFSINKREYIDEDIDYNMYKYINDTLKKHGYIHYETSNYAKPHYESKHNLVYWNNEEYYGFGLSAVSYLNNYRLTNTKNISKYLKGIYLDNSIYEDVDIQKQNTIILGFRKLEGINLTNYQNRYHENLLDNKIVISLIKEGKLEVSNNYLRISDKYFYISNEILINFI